MRAFRSSTPVGPLDISRGMQEPEVCEGCGRALESVVVMVHTTEGWRVFHAECIGVNAA
jgi:hypothetical protein